MFNIGPYTVENRCVLAPMAGITDKPFRILSREYGAGLAVSEMVTSDIKLWNSRKTLSRIDTRNEPSPISIQIAGSAPQQLAEAAIACENAGAKIVDINMGCPAKKVCNKAAGSSLLKDTVLVENILNAVTSQASVPVTLKIRTGWDTDSKNATTIAKIAEQSGIQALTVHGRTRACRFKGAAEYDTIRDVVKSVSIPVIANGDIDSPEKAKFVLDYTGAAAVMVGRGAQGNPWIFNRINNYLSHKIDPGMPHPTEVAEVIIKHLTALYEFYGELHGCRIARKHLSWYLAKHIDTAHKSKVSDLRAIYNKSTSKQQQLMAVQDFFKQLYQSEDQAA